jgi:TonB family protein
MKRVVIAFAIGVTGACASTGGLEVPLPPPPRPLPELVDQLSAPDAPSRASAAWALAGAKQADPAMAAALQKLLDDPSGPVREAATWALGHLVSPDATSLSPTLDTPPRLLVQTRPTYPQIAFDQKITGTVHVEILINETGRVVHAEVRRSIPELDKAALACVREWQFAPGQRAGKPVVVLARSPVTFRIY